MFNNVIRWDLLEQPENRAFHEDFKKLIRIRRQYPAIFDCFPDNHRDSNIAKVESNCGLQAYARYADGRAVLVRRTTPIPLSRRRPLSIPLLSG